MPWPNCSTAKDALTDLKEILSRSQTHTCPSSRLETAQILSCIEATISSIEEKSFAVDDFHETLGVPTVTGLTAPVTVI